MESVSHLDCLDKLKLKISDYSTEWITTHDKPSNISAQNLFIQDYDIKQYELTQLHDLLCDIQLSITQDIMSLENVLLQSKQVLSIPGKRCVADISPKMLSCKENQVLNMFAKGYSYNEVAELLGCKLATIQTHAKRIYKKLHVHSRSEAIYEARQLNLLTG